MELILRDNYLHLVLSEADLENFRTYHEVEESVRFGETFGDKIVFSIRTNHSYEQLQIRYIANEIQVLLPKPLAHELIYTDLAHFERQLKVGEGRTLELKVSKDPMDLAEQFLESQLEQARGEDQSTAKDA